MRHIKMHSHIFLCPDGQLRWRICRFAYNFIFQRFGVLISNQLHIETVVERWKSFGDYLLFSIRNNLVSRLDSPCIRLYVIHKGHGRLVAYLISWLFAQGSSIGGALIGNLFRDATLVSTTLNQKSRSQSVLYTKSFPLVRRRSQGRSQWSSFRCSEALVIWVDAVIIYAVFFYHLLSKYVFLTVHFYTILLHIFELVRSGHISSILAISHSCLSALSERWLSSRNRLINSLVLFI